MVLTKLLMEDALAIRPCSCGAAPEPLLPKVARCIPVLSSCYMGKCATRVLKLYDLSHSAVSSLQLILLVSCLVSTLCMVLSPLSALAFLCLFLGLKMNEHLLFVESLKCLTDKIWKYSKDKTSINVRSLNFNVDA